MKNNNAHNEHDKHYKAVFEHKEMVLEMLHSFVKEDWVKDIKIEDLHRYINSRLQF